MQGGREKRVMWKEGEERGVLVLVHGVLMSLVFSNRAVGVLGVYI